MAVFELVIALLLVGAVLSAWARRLNAPYPALLALAGAALALIPGTPTVVLDPQLALALFVAPVLLDAAFDASPRDLRALWRPVTSLALGAVVSTVAAVALVARWLVPEMPWPAAIALGAIVAPPDASAATAVLRQLRPPHRLLIVLEGESLFNDATALLIYRLAVAAGLTGVAVGWGLVPTLLGVTVGSVALGAALSRLLLIVTPYISDIATAVVVQFLTTFAVWLLAERLHLSGIVTMVTFAILVARRVPDLIPARVRIPSYAVWEVAVFVLNVLAFILVGLQLKPILGRLDRSGLIAYAETAAAVLVAVIVVRIVWVVLTEGRRSRRESAIVAWCGMRGTVTLAAALALPDGASPFPYRDLILFTSFWVVLGTLVLQGMTLPALMHRLGLADDGTVDDEIRVARRETALAALDALDGDVDAAEDARLLKRKYQLRVSGANGGSEAQATGLTAAMHAAQRAERRRLSELRADGTIGDDAFHRIEEELDWAELGAQGMLRRD